MHSMKTDEQNMIQRTLILTGLVTSICIASVDRGQGNDSISYAKHVAPIFTKHCAGCHNDTDREGDFSLSSLDSLRKGTPEGKVLVAGSPEESKLLQLITGQDEPNMPPEDEPRPTKAEIEIIRQWIEQGMPVDGQVESASSLHVPKLAPAAKRNQYIGAAAVAGTTLTIGKLGRVETIDLNDSQEVGWVVDGFAGKINALRTSYDEKHIVVSSGIAGIGGEISLLDASSGDIVSQFRGHADSVYCASLSPDGKWLASGSYDRKVLLWNVASGEILHELNGHNGAIYDLDFDPSGKVLATASADQTVKLWNVRTGKRLDTFGQPEGEMLCVRFSADGNFIFASGTDRQIRKWQLLSRDKPTINPMIVARFAHESDVLQLQLLGDDKIISASSDRAAKVWNTNLLEPIGEVAKLKDVPIAICIPSTGEIASLVVELKGARHEISREDLNQLAIQAANRTEDRDETREAAVAEFTVGESIDIQEVEPNNSVRDAVKVDLPVNISGTISPTQTNQVEDFDLYRFTAQAGQPWVIEAKAESGESKLDTFIDILDAFGKPMVRTRMQAIRESYFTFRGKDGDTSDDFRLHKWEDMELDEYLYSSGEVTKLWLYPRGPDSGFKVYPGSGKRFTYFDSTAVSHALGEPAYVVRELKPGEESLPNGLPVFPLYYENDDDGLRREGKNSRLSFVAKESGDYFLRIRDARGFGGEDFGYKISMRPPKPDFTITVSDNELTMPTESGREWSVTATRIDGLSSPISVHILGLPDGFLATNPLIIEAGQQTALGTIFATSQAQIANAAIDDAEDVQKKTEGKGETEEKVTEVGERKDAEKQNTSDGKTPPQIELRLIARCDVNGREIVHELKDTLKLSLTETKDVQLNVLSTANNRLTELTIHPGETISAKVVVERNGTESRIGFGKEDSGRNLPHGAYVDNIGLNGLLITEQQSEREFFITAAPKVQSGRRQFHLRGDTKGNPTSRPIWLNVVSE